MGELSLPNCGQIRDALEQVAQNGIPGPGHAKLLDVGTAEYLSAFETEILDGLIARGGATCRFFEGAYGAGKTHLLGLLSDTAASRGIAVARADLSQAMSMEDWRAITVHVLENMEIVIDGDRVRSLPQVLQALRRADRVNLKALREAALPHSGFQIAMLRAVEGWVLGDYVWELLRRYLLGEKVTASTMKKVGLPGIKDPLSKRNAEQVLATVVSGLHALGVPGTMLLFDENERTLVFNRANPPKKVMVAANLIRRLIDGCVTGGLSGTIAVFAVLPGFFEGCSRVYPALGQRIELPRTDLHTPAWRWPILRVEDVTSLSDPMEFAAALIKRLEELVVVCGGQSDAIHKKLLEAAADVLATHAGSGYRRPLLKQLTGLAYACL